MATTLTQKAGNVVAASVRNLTTMLAPAVVRFRPNYTQIGDRFYMYLLVNNLPHQIIPGWLDNLCSLNVPHEVDFYPKILDATASIGQLQRQYKAMTATTITAQRKGHIVTSDVKLAMDELNAQLMKLETGEDRVLSLDFLISTWGSTPAEASERLGLLQNVARRCGISTMRMNCRSEQNLRSQLPDGSNQVKMPKQVDVSTLAVTYPLASANLNMTGGALFGLNLRGMSPVLINPWDDKNVPNPNIMIIGEPGAGKSFFTKLMIQRLALQGVRQFIIDPENEYTKLAEGLGGRVVYISASRPFVFNLFELPTTADGKLSIPTLVKANGSEGGEADALTEKVDKLIPILTMMLGTSRGDSSGGTRELDDDDRNLLEHAIFQTFERCGITRDEIISGRLDADVLEQGTNTFADLLAAAGGGYSRNRELAANFQLPRIPTLADLKDTLQDITNGDQYGTLLGGLESYISGSKAGFFSNRLGQLSDSDRVTVFGIKDLSKELRPLVIAMVMEHVWSLAVRYGRPTQFVLDEAWEIIRSAAGGELVESFARKSRKRKLSTVIATQQTQDFLYSKSGQAIMACCATKWIGKQDPSNSAPLQEGFKLNSAQLKFVTRQVNRGQALLKCGTRWVPLEVVYSQSEYKMAETSTNNNLAIAV